MAGIKYDDGKNMVQLLPVYPLWEIGRIYSFGCSKYSADNWRGGMKWTRIYGAVLRHLWKWAAGQDLDAESGLPHLAHAAFGLLTLLEYSQTHPEFDDRAKIQARIPETYTSSAETQAPELQPESYSVTNEDWTLVRPIPESCEDPDKDVLSLQSEAPATLELELDLPICRDLATQPREVEMERCNCSHEAGGRCIDAEIPA